MHSDPYEVPAPSRIVRKVPNDSPILDPLSADLACNRGGEEPAGDTADIQAGQTVQFIWSRVSSAARCQITELNLGQWPADHRGPITVWMASCGSSCSTFKTSGAKWFAIEKTGMNADGSYATDNLIAAAASWTTAIPFNVAPGEYLLRIELLALHSIGAPQFYPSCSQIRVSGTGNGVPRDGEVVPIQNIYKGYSFPNIWKPGSVFKIAGPAVAAFAASASPARTSLSSPLTGVTSSIHTPAAMTQPTAVPSSSVLVLVPVNFMDPLSSSTSKLLSNRIVRQKVSPRKTKRWTSPINTPSLGRHKRRVARRHRDFSY